MLLIHRPCSPIWPERLNPSSSPSAKNPVRRTFLTIVIAYPNVRFCHGWLIPSHRWSNRAFRFPPARHSKYYIWWPTECVFGTFPVMNHPMCHPLTYLHGNLPLRCWIGWKYIFQGSSLLPSQGVGGFPNEVFVPKIGDGQDGMHDSKLIHLLYPQLCYVHYDIVTDICGNKATPEGLL